MPGPTERFPRNTALPALSAVQLTAPERAVLTLGNPHLPSDDVASTVTLMMARSFGWNAFLALARKLRVGATIGWHAGHHPDIAAAVPQDVRDALLQQQRYAAIRLSAYKQAMAPVLQDLADSGVAVALMKGAAITDRFYPPGTRLLNDLDILIDKTHYPIVARCFEASGFKKHLDTHDAEQEKLAHFHQIVFKRTVGGQALSVDVHWALFPPYQPFPTVTSELLARALPIDFGNARTRALTAEDTFVQYALQHVIDDFHTTYFRLMDLAQLAKSGLRWDAVYDTAQTWRAMGFVYAAARSAALFDANPPCAFLEEAAGRSSLRVLAAGYLADVRWILPRWQIPHAARPFLMAALDGDRMAPFWTLMKEYAAHFRHRRRLGASRSGATLHTMRFIALSIVWAAALVGTVAAERRGPLRGQQWRASLWKR